MKKLAALLTAVLLCLALAGCAKEEKISDEEVVNTFLQAYQQGDYEAMKPYISDDNPLHRLFAGMDDAVGGEMAPVYRAFYEQAKTITWTAKAVEGQENWGTVSLEFTVPNYYEAIKASMAAAIEEEVANGGGSFHDMPGWLLQALDGEVEMVQDTYEIHVGNRDGEMVMDTNTNRRLFIVLCGGLQEYMGTASMTTCTFPDGTAWELAAKGDEIVGAICSENIPGASLYAPEDLALVIESFALDYEGVDGVCAGGTVQDDLLISRLGIDMWTVSSFNLMQMGMLDSILTSSSWLSLESTVSGFTREGASCVTETFMPEQPAE